MLHEFTFNRLSELPESLLQAVAEDHGIALWSYRGTAGKLDSRALAATISEFIEIAPGNHSARRADAWRAYQVACYAVKGAANLPAHLQAVQERSAALAAYLQAVTPPAALPTLADLSEKQLRRLLRARRAAAALIRHEVNLENLFGEAPEKHKALKRLNTRRVIVDRQCWRIEDEIKQRIAYPPSREFYLIFADTRIPASDKEYTNWQETRGAALALAASTNRTVEVCEDDSFYAGFNPDGTEY